VATLAWLAQEAAIEMHPWTATIEAPDRPRYALIDIDPGESTTWDEVLVLARLFRTALAHLGVIGLPKTAGSAASIWIPITDQYTRRDRSWSSNIGRSGNGAGPRQAWAKRDHRGRARQLHQKAPIRPRRAVAFSRRQGARFCAHFVGGTEDPDLAPDRWTVRSLPSRLTALGLFAPAVYPPGLHPSAARARPMAGAPNGYAARNVPERGDGLRGPAPGGCSAHCLSRLVRFS
jgi:bifunctional non-homologous end joining protein LigD